MKIVILVAGGCVQGVYHTDLDGVEVVLLDSDNMKEKHTGKEIDTIFEHETKGLPAAKVREAL